MTDDAADPAVSPDAFKQLMGRFASGVTIVTTADDGDAPYGLTATAFSSVSLTPPLCLVCVDHRAEAYPVILKTKRFAVNFLAEDQGALSAKFAISDTDKFEGVEWSPGGGTACPLLAGVVASAECELVAAHTEGDHDILVGAIRRAHVTDRSPLLYWNGHYGDFVEKGDSD